MKKYILGETLLITCTALSLLLIVHFHRLNQEKITIQNFTYHEVPKVALAAGLPKRITIPAIEVNSVIQSVGVTISGEMGTPNNTIDVGWFRLGPRPGEKGNAVIAGHVDDANGFPGVFANLYKLKKGDTLYIEDASGITYTFTVRGSYRYDPGFAEDVFSPTNDITGLNLITCDGSWDTTTNSFRKRLVVFAEII